MLKLNLGVSNLTKVKVPKSFFEKAIFETFKILGLDGDIEVSLAIVGKKKMRELNKKHRGKDKATDVLSFSFVSPKLLVKAGFYEDEREKEDFLNMGEVVICLSYAKRQAKEEGKSLQEELALLASHGAIHLFGIDHERSEIEAGKTDSIQDDVLRKIFR